VSSQTNIPAALERKLYLDGIQLFNTHEYFAAHEAWEEVWRAAAGRRRRFYHGLIQCAVALEHYRRSNPRGVLSLYQSYPPKFHALPDLFMGLDLRLFLAQMQTVLTPVVQARPVPERGTISLDLSLCPQIRLIGDPFEAVARGGDD
jgi:hypothetical protein